MNSRTIGIYIVIRFKLHVKLTKYQTNDINDAEIANKAYKFSFNKRSNSFA